MSEITFDQAVDIIRRGEEPTWDTANGRFYIDPVGKEDGTSYYVSAGAYEDLVEGNWDYTNFAPLARFVDKTTGEVTTEPMVTARIRLRRMRKVSTATSNR